MTDKFSMLVNLIVLAIFLLCAVFIVDTVFHMDRPQGQIAEIGASGIMIRQFGGGVVGARDYVVWGGDGIVGSCCRYAREESGTLSVYVMPCQEGGKP